MRRGALAVAILLIAGVAAYFFVRHPRPEPPPVAASSPEISSNSGQTPPANQNDATVPPAAANSEATDLTASTSSSAAARAGQLMLGTNAVADLPAATVAANVRRAVRQFGAMFGGDPVGTNPEITRQLLGDNPRHINFVDPSAGMRVNEKGELVDAWGTPYFFHQISGSEMEIHSAGPDKIMWTADDIVVK